MDSAQFATVKLTPNKLDIWIKFNMNVMLIGEKGVGKSTQIIEAFNKNDLKWVYFSGATLDPWTDLVGIPKPKVNERGESVIEYIRPEVMSDDIEAIFCDEFNRCHKKVKNALLELIQFKSINGRKFPRLRFVWAAINPDDDESNYDVEPVDPAQLDRFHVIVNLPYKPDKAYFVKKFNKTLGNQAIIWWEQQPDSIKKSISPRRLDYAMEAFLLGIDISDILPKTSNLIKLKDMLSMSPSEIAFLTAYDSGDTDKQAELLNDDSTFEELKKILLSDNKYYINVSTLLHNEKISALYESYSPFADWIKANPTLGKNREILKEKQGITFKAGTSVANDIKSILPDGDFDVKAKVLSTCTAFTALTRKLTPKEYETNFNSKFYPFWLDYFHNHRGNHAVSKVELAQVSEYIVKIYQKLDAKYKDRIKGVIRDIVDIFCHISMTPLRPVIIHEAADTVQQVCQYLNPNLGIVFKNIFGVCPSTVTISNLRNI